MYDFKKIEAKWQKYWEDNKTYKFNKDNIDKKFYCLEMFSYPSGANLHLGHWYNFGVTDTWARLKRMQGFEVFHPMGFDAFGLPAENYAIKTGVHPKDSITKNTDTMEKQLKAIGATYDWDYKIITSTPDYYKWTQWMFLKLYEKGLAYKKEAPVNFCPSCQTVLANEQVVSGNCERCNTQVERKKLSQWFFKITEYADELLNGLEDIDWPEKTKTLQKNWIGKSKGAMVKFTVVDKNTNFEVFTTRVDTLYGCTYCVLAPENELVEKITTKDNLDQVHKYLKEASKISEIDRMSTVKEKTGVFTGSYALNPVNGKKIPIWIADYVIGSYGTGAVMAVPAHDERDYEFAKKYDLEIIPVIERITGTANENESFRKSIVALVFDPNTNKYLTLDWKDKGGTLLIGGTIHDEEDIVVCATREITEETGYKNLKYISSSFPINHHYYAFNKNKYFSIEATGVYFELINEEITDNNLDEDEKDCFNIKWLSKEEVETEIKDELHITIFENLINPTAYTENGLMCNSSEMDGLDNEIAAVKIVDKLNKINSGKFITNYRLRDWLVSRQRYWGAPIPIIYCDKCGTVPVPEKDLPVELPYDVEFKPDGKSPLSKSEAFINTKCPKCGGPAKREADTLDTFVCSSWYFLRYPDVNNDQEPFNKELINKMLPVDKYVGGIEHACMHLLYARFFTKALRDMGYLNFDEPFKSLVHQGTILGSDGEKMSKSKGNTISPDEYIEKYGSDVLRTYLMFGFNYVDGGPWKDDGIKSTAKFYERIYRVVEYFKDNYNEENFSDIDLVMNKTIKEVIKDTEKFQFNTAISRLMEYLNILTKYMTSKKKINKEYIINLVLLIAPFAPHLSEELWTMLGYKESIFKESYPQADVSKIKEDTYEMVVQVNGKVRARKTVKIDINEEEMKQEALSDDNVQVHLQDKKIVKIISVPQKLINIVVK